MANTSLFKFKTNINCGGCVAAVKPILDNIDNLDSWQVDTSSKEKTLTLQCNAETKNAAIQAVENQGFLVNELKHSNISKKWF